MNKLLSIWKPIGLSSYDIIREIKHYIPKNIKIGHCGTLDPFANGILLVCYGENIKNIANYFSLEKTYEAEILLGNETDTLDNTGKIIKSDSKKISLTKTKIQKVLNNFKGTYQQTPPYFSAKKINGIRLYKLARRDIFIRLKGISVNINDIKLLSFDVNKIKLLIKCDTGTYIRSLAKDVAYTLNTFGYLNKLTRTAIGCYNESNSILYEDINNCLNTIN